ncbi:MAG: D-aminoacylase [Chloroflexi bacterium]|nr:D-aminoacylase [Chloroflexota bacterium]
MFDLVLRGGRVVDGSGNPWFRADVGLREGRIAAVGRLGNASAAATIDLDDLTVAPGFVDTHTHSDLIVLAQPLLAPKLFQGVTVELVGQDGLGVAPIRPAHVSAWRRHLSGLQGDPPIPWSWTTFGEYLEAIEAARPAQNIAALVSHSPVRMWAMGMANRAPSEVELVEMVSQVDQAMLEGAFGFSTGLIYPPGNYGDAAEIAALCRPVGERGGIYVTHVRNEGAQLLEALEEALAIGRESNTPVHVSHFKATGLAHRGLMPKGLRLFELAREGGQEVTFDQYPYAAGSTLLSSVLPDWAHEGGSLELLARLRDPATRERIRTETGERMGDEWHSVTIASVRSERLAHYQGQRVDALAAAEGKAPEDLVLDLLAGEELEVSRISFWGSEDDVAENMKHPLGTICSDGLLIGRPHPRTYGTFPRVLAEFVRRRRALSLEAAIARMTSRPAERLGLSSRGWIRPGYWADLVVFDPATIADRATYEDPCQPPAGIKYVFVNGQMAVQNGQVTGVRAGQVLRHL